jgi:hypothetical protein
MTTKCDWDGVIAIGIIVFLVAGYSAAALVVLHFVIKYW